MARKKTGLGWCRQSPVPVGGGGRVGLRVTSGRPPWCPPAGTGQWCGGIGCTASGGSRGIGFSWPALGLAPRPGRRRQPARWHQARPLTHASHLPHPSFSIFLSKQWMHDGSRARQGSPFMSITPHSAGPEGRPACHTRLCAARKTVAWPPSATPTPPHSTTSPAKPALPPDHGAPPDHHPGLHMQDLTQN